jgi:leucyl aminopeptidase
MGRMSRLPLLLAKCGEIHLLAGDSAEALRLATTALALATEQKERGNEVYARHLLGELHAAAEPSSAQAQRYYADALALADEEKPALIADFATLTGAARVALGPELPALFTDDDALATELSAAGAAENDPLWRLPLWQPYAAMLDSKVADMNNVSTGGQGGAITAALFLRRFVAEKSWLHLDIFAWTASAKPGRPEGAELQMARALYAMLSKRYS